MKIQIGVNPKILKGLVFSLVPFLSGCFMMFLPAMPMVSDSHQVETDPDVKKAINELIKESADDLVNNRSKYALILLGEVKVDGNFISSDKARMLMLEKLREKKELNIHIRDDSSRDVQNVTDMETSSNLKPMAVLNTQFYSSEGQIWQAQQLVDMRSNRLFWSANHSVRLPEPTPG